MAVYGALGIGSWQTSVLDVRVPRRAPVIGGKKQNGVKTQIRLGLARTGRAQPESPHNSTVAFIRANQKPHGKLAASQQWAWAPVAPWAAPLRYPTCLIHEGVDTPNAAAQGGFVGHHIKLSPHLPRPPAFSPSHPPLQDSAHQQTRPFCTSEAAQKPQTWVTPTSTPSRSTRSACWR
jgi:hypothetical protein